MSGRIWPSGMRGLLHLALPAVLIVLIVHVVGAGDIASRLAAANPVWIAAAGAACLAQMLLSAWRWRLTAARLGLSIPMRMTVTEYYLSSAINATIPGGVVGDAARAVRMRERAGLEIAAQAVIVERLAGQVALVATLGLGITLSGKAELQEPAALIFAVAALVAASVGVAVRVSENLFVPAVMRRLGTAIATCWLNRRDAMSQITLSILIVAANLASFAFAARATGTVIGFPDLLYAIPLILFAMLVPLSVMGWGYREGAAALVFPIIGAGAAAGVSASIAFGAVIVIVSLPGLFVLLFGRMTTAERTSEASEQHHGSAS